MRKKSKSYIARIAKNIKLLILDVDGVLTDGSIILDNKGNEYKSFHVRDGHGIKMLLRAGIKVAVLTGRESKVVERRAAELGITEVYQKCFNKTAVYHTLIKKFSLLDREVAYVGDDVVDVPVMRKVGMPVTVADAAGGMKKYSVFTTKNRGGRGAVREVTDLILSSKGLWKRMTDEYLEA